jgi:DNA primase
MDNKNNQLSETIISQADIVSVIGSFIKISKKGANYVALCPFHPDSNPSLSISPTKKI